jgi:signal transduction histidine kinase
MNIKKFSKLLIPFFYTVGILGVVLYQLNEQNMVRRGTENRIYRNLMDSPAFVRKGFDESELFKVPDTGGEWVQFKSKPLRIMESPLQNLPKRKYLSPLGTAAEEFTIIIPVEVDYEVNEKPGIFLGYIGENWEVYFNGQLVISEMHLNVQGKITSRRNWRDVYFPLERNLFVQGTNILAIRIIGDPAYGVTGLYYSAPYYMDEYRHISRQHQNVILLLLCGIFGYTGFYYLMIFFSVLKREEVFNLYYGIFSILLCLYAITGSGIINNIIPNSDIQIRLEYLSLFLSIPTLCIFVEQMGWQKITNISRIFFIFSIVLALTQIFFCNQYGDEVLMIWSVSVLIYFSFVFVYDIVYFYFFELRKKNRGRREADTFVSILIGSVIVYACGLWDVLDVLFFYSSLRLFLYSTFVFHIVMAFTLSNRFRGMYNRLEYSKIILEQAVHERTEELAKQTDIAIEASQAKSRFLATMSHEIRTPLNAVIGLSQIELHNNLSEKTRSSIMEIHKSGSILLGIINDILDISKIEAGSFALVPVEYESERLINDIVNLNMVRIGSEPIDFVLEISGDFPAALFGDELRVKQILNNILSNAIKYTREGSVTLTIEYKEISKTVFLIRFVVRDTGIGIRSEDMGKLFTDYTQLDAKANRKIEGTGLGLVITKKLVDMMGGNITVQSEYGKGSCFTVEVTQELAGTKTIGEETAEKLRNLSYQERTAGNEGYEMHHYSSVLKELSHALEAADAFEIERILNELNEKPLDEKYKETLKKISHEVLMAEYENALKIIRGVESGEARQKSELMSLISHELRTPLAVISGFAELTAENAKKSIDSGEFENFGEILSNLDAIASEARRMADLLDKIEEN